MFLPRIDGTDELGRSALSLLEQGKPLAALEALGLKIWQFVGIMGDEAATVDDEILARQAAERHMDLVIEKLKHLKVS